MKKLISLGLLLTVACTVYIPTDAREIRVRERKGKTHRHMKKKMKKLAPYIVGAALITVAGLAVGVCCFRRGVKR